MATSLPSYSLVSPTSVVFYVGRHATTEENQDDMFRGAENPNLNDQGKHEAQEQADFMKGRTIGDLFTSPYLRAQQTIAPLATQLGKEPKILEGLGSWNIGVASGQPEEGAAEDMVQYYVDHPEETIPEGESLNHFKARVYPIFKMAIENKKQTGLPPFLEGHNSVIHELGLLYSLRSTELSLAGAKSIGLVKPGGIVAVHTTRSGGMHAVPIFKAEEFVEKSEEEQ